MYVGDSGSAMSWASGGGGKEMFGGGGADGIHKGRRISGRIRLANALICIVDVSFSVC
jgi:hypothetical protein